MEIWKDIKDYEGNYKVSNKGKVRSIERYDNRGCLVKGRIKKAYSTKKGYQMVNLYKNNKVKNLRLHRLVAMAFIPNPENKEEINHIDGNKTNNNVGNLEWSTCEENIKHAIETGLILTKKTKITKNGISLEFDSLASATRHIGCGVSSTSKVATGKGHSIYGWKIEYIE